MKNTLGLFIVSCLLGCASPSSTSSYEPENGAPQGFPDVIGFGAVRVPEYLGSSSDQIVPAFFLDMAVGEGRIEFQGFDMRLDVVPAPGLRAGPSVGFSLPRNNDVDSDVVVALDNVRSAVEVGGFVGIVLPVEPLPGGVFRGTLTLRQDVADGHGGLNAIGSVDLGFSPTKRLRLSGALRLEANDNEFADSYFSVSAGESIRSGLERFNASGGLRGIGGSLFSSYALTQEWNLWGLVGFTRLINDARESPVIDDEGDMNQLTVGLGISYIF